MELRIAAAADLQDALPELVATFEKTNPGVTVATTFGASGSLVAQIQNGAPFDLFLSADTRLVEHLIAEGKGIASSKFSYGQGQLVLWAPGNASFDVTTEGLRALTRAEVRKVAIANPEHAPYGAAAMAALRRAGLYDAVSARLVLGENVAQAAQFVESGAADAGLISESLARSPRLVAAGHYIAVPDSRLPQAGVILTESKLPEMARLFREAMLSTEGRAILQRHGISPP